MHGIFGGRDQARFQLLNEHEGKPVELVQKILSRISIRALFIFSVVVIAFGTILLMHRASSADKPTPYSPQFPGQSEPQETRELASSSDEVIEKPIQAINRPYEQIAPSVLTTTKKTPASFRGTAKGKLIEVDTSDFDTSPLKPLDGEELSDRWVVVTTIQKPTDDMRLLGEMSKYGWRVLAVGDKKTPTDWKAPPGVRFLSRKEASQLNYNLMRYHKWGDYPAKTVGYMFAIHHGAKLIYDTDDDNHPTDQLRSMLELAGVEFDGRKGSAPRNLTRALYWSPGKLAMPVINPLPHFGQSLLWPRGYPLREISRQPLRNYTLCTTRPPAWIQGVVNGDPDVDAIYRLTRKHLSTEINMTFDRAPSVMAPQGYYVQTNSQNTLFVQSAVPFIFLPYTVTMRETDIWRAYIGQRMLWLSGNRKGYVSPNAFQARNPHDYLKDFKDEMKLYLDVEDLVGTLEEWSCPEKYDTGECFEQIYRILASSNCSFVLRDDAYAAAAWVADLRRIGYPFPKRGERPDCVASQKTNQKTLARLYPIEQKTTVPAHEQLVCALGRNEDAQFFQLLELCAEEQKYLGKEMKPSFSKPTPTEDLTLLVDATSIADKSDFEYIAKQFHLFYRPFLPRMLFCVNEQVFNDGLAKATVRKYSISMVQLTESDSAVAGCVKTASEIRMNGKAFLYIDSSADAVVTPNGIREISSKLTESAAGSNDIVVAACSDSNSPAVAVVKADSIATLSSSDFSEACSDQSSSYLTSMTCSDSPLTETDVEYYVLANCTSSDNNEVTFGNYCSIFLG